MLELKKLSLGYGPKSVLDDVNLSFEPGKIHTIVGRNGCGKSTLLRCCAGLLPPAGGSVLLDGRALADYPPKLRSRRISYLSQSITAPNISARRLLSHARFPYLSYPGKLQEEDRQIIAAALADMEADALADRSLRDLSGGERQRIYLAMQLAQDAPILLLDEPTTYLDIEYQLLLMERLQKLREQGKTIIMVLHDLEQALRCSDRIIAIDGGRVIHSGTPEEIRTQGTLRKVFHVDVLHREYAFKRNSPTAPQ